MVVLLRGLDGRLRRSDISHHGPINVALAALVPIEVTAFI
jgi:hypothetical protein